MTRGGGDSHRLFFLPHVPHARRNVDAFVAASDGRVPTGFTAAMKAALHRLEQRVAEFRKVVVELPLDARRQEGEGLDEPLHVRIGIRPVRDPQSRGDLGIAFGEVRTLLAERLQFAEIVLREPARFQQRVRHLTDLHGTVAPDDGRVEGELQGFGVHMEARIHVEAGSAAAVALLFDGHGHEVEARLEERDGVHDAPAQVLAENPLHDLRLVRHNHKFLSSFVRDRFPAVAVRRAAGGRDAFYGGRFGEGLIELGDGLATLPVRLNEALAISLDKAEEHADAMMAGQSHFSHAQPTTYGAYLLAVGMGAGIKTQNPKAALLAPVATLVQFTGYGLGFLKSTILLTFSRKKPEELFPRLFFKP